ncbi:ABC transporter ATP-binding protein [Dyadobacter jiangsuensis]|uniref:ABC-type multidrug transport system ATPase subunit n=1 Tax=Dyadobacter jiangsuensis TaxID=1591085 RepID=A0A2P8FNF1_9BACT|nr:ABC transporter ATP-binding protein [Dyadobacter jiangsuensis]PSL23258.1 ABC-type multidrug transport system ATPase subunit [Dyadobacter jiangsuensis]
MQRLTIQGLSKTYPNGIRALDNVSLEIPNGMFGLLGPNGAGKSTFMRILATLTQADSGLVTFDGQDIARETDWLRSRLGYLPQDFGVYPGVSAESLLDHLAVLKGLIHKTDRREQVAALLQRTNLYQHRKQAVSTFSGGMRQRFGIAQALLGNPQLVIVDEPTAGLDPSERNRFHDLLSEIGEHIVVILSTHIVDDVHDLCPQMAVLASGRVVLEGKPEALTHSLKGRLWRKTVTPAELTEMQATVDVISTRRVAGRIQVHVLADVCPGNAFEAFDPGLEDVYFATLPGIGRKEVQPC